MCSRHAATGSGSSSLTQKASASHSRSTSGWPKTLVAQPAFGYATIVQQERLAEVAGDWQSFDQLIAATAMKAYARGLLPLPLRGDFPAFRKPYRSLSADERSLVHSIAAERHYALEWLCRPGVEWDETRTDT